MNPSFIVLATALIACATGYEVRLHATRIEQVDPTLAAQLGDIARAKGLVARMVEHRNINAPDFSLTSHYSKELSPKPHDAIRIDVIYSDERSASQSIHVFIENRVSGMEPPVKREIDALGDACYDLLARAVGRDKVSVEKGPVPYGPW